LNFENTVEIIRQKAKYGDIFILENEDSGLYICRAPTIREFRAWSEVCAKLDLNPAITAMSIAYVTQVYPQETMPEDVAITIGSDIINSTSVTKDKMKEEYESHSKLSIMDWLIYNVWQLTGVQPKELESMSISDILKLYNAASNIAGVPSVFDEQQLQQPKKDMFAQHQSAEEMNEKFEKLKNKFESVGLDIEKLSI